MPRMLALALLVVGCFSLPARAPALRAIDVGSRLELFVDDALIERLGGGASLRLHQPVTRNVALVTDAPWEGNACHYRSVFQDGARYRMYYSGYHWAEGGAAEKALPAHPGFLLYAESDDGVRWTKPELGLVAFGGSTRNNIVVAPGLLPQADIDPGHAAVFKDDNPSAPPDARYKALVVGARPRGLYAFKSPDGIRFSPMSERPVVTRGAFDSQNLAFWDPVRGEYREYHRDFRDRRRGIRTSTSRDFLHWSDDPDWVEFPGAPEEQLYTNQVRPYYRAPHILMGFPMRYVDRGVTATTYDLPRPELRRLLVGLNPRYGTTVTDALFMTSRDALRFKRWSDAFIRPGLETEGQGRWFYGDNSVAWGLVETRAAVEGGPPEISLFATEGYREGTSLAVRRYSLRVDGFVSLAAPLGGGECLTRPLVFAGSTLVLNFSTSAAGSVQVEIQDENGRPVPGHTLQDSPEIFGDAIERTVRWKATSDVSRLAGRAVRLRFVLKDADVYSFRFR